MSMTLMSSLLCRQKEAAARFPSNTVIFLVFLETFIERKQRKGAL